jgi:catechol 2,3-dioxygenase-like lactoylglutathione lyase family enzyme
MRTAAVSLAGVVLFAAGLIVGSVVTPAGAQERNTGLRLNHVQITVPNLDEALAYYTKVMGFRVAYALPSPDGRPATTFVQINRDTFLEVAPAAPNVTPGITHIGLWSDDINATVAQLRRAGATVADARSGGTTGSKLLTVFDPRGIRLEINEQPPGSLMRKAMDAWK